MCIKTTNRPSHSGSHQILLVIQIDKVRNGRLENRPDDLARDNSLSHDTLSASFNPIDRSWLLIRAVVSTYSKDLHLRKESEPTWPQVPSRFPSKSCSYP